MPAAIVYTKFLVGGLRRSKLKVDVALYDLATDTEKMVTRSGASIQPTWSPDGKRIAYIGSFGFSGGAVQAGTVWTVEPDGSNPQKVGAASGADDDLFWADIDLLSPRACDTGSQCAPPK